MTGGVRVEPEDGYVALMRGKKPIAATDYVIDTRRAVVQKQGILRSRAKIVLPWWLEFILDWDEETLPQKFPDSLKEDILPSGGRVIGLLDYRPEKRGWFGRFKVVSVEAA
jgi:hypothetical protein